MVEVQRTKLCGKGGDNTSKRVVAQEDHFQVRHVGKDRKVSTQFVVSEAQRRQIYQNFPRRGNRALKLVVGDG
jgi:hypothetical protein